VIAPLPIDVARLSPPHLPLTYRPSSPPSLIPPRGSVQVPFLGAWSPSLFPRPKDWPARLEVVGAILDDDVPPPPPPAPASAATAAPSSSSSAAGGSDAPTAAGAEEGLGPGLRPALASPLPPALRLFFAHADTAPAAPAPASPGGPSSSRPPAAAADGADTGAGASDGGTNANANANTNNIVFVGFGSMVIEDPSSLLALLLQGERTTARSHSPPFRSPQPHCFHICGCRRGGACGGARGGADAGGLDRGAGRGGLPSPRRRGPAPRAAGRAGTSHLGPYLGPYLISIYTSWPRRHVHHGQYRRGCV